MGRFNGMRLVVFLPILIVLCGCQVLVPHDTQSLLDPNLKRSVIVGLVAGFGTAFAVLPDLVAMLRRMSPAGMNPRMAAIMGIFQNLRVYYGLLILSPPVVIWNVVAIVVNFVTSAYLHFARKEKEQRN